jgi:hypothetical protein
MAAEHAMPSPNEHSTLDYQSVHRITNEQRPMPPAFLRRGLLQLGRMLNAPFRCETQ